MERRGVPGQQAEETVGQLQEGSTGKNAPPPEVLPKTVDMGPLPGLIGYVLRRAQLAVFQDFEHAYAEFAIRPAQYAVLTVIEHNPGLKQTEVGAALGFKRANFVAMCDELETRGLIERRVQATDRRSYALHLTRKGKTLIARLHEVNEAHEARLIAEIGEEGHEQLLAMLSRLAALASGHPE
jgi:DNA-binding MarR family transcriptional regulator